VNDVSSVGDGVDPRREAGEVESRGADRSIPWVIAHLLPVAVAGVLVLFGAKILLERWLLFDRMGLIGVDLDIYLGYARRFVDTGSMYAANQLTGPYAGQPYVSGPIPADMPSLYPPTTIYLFAPFLVLPSILWWVIPLGVVAYVFLHLRPALWTWPVIVLPLVTPDFTAGLVTGNTGMWLLAAVAGGLVWGWPGLLVLIKPFLAPFALIGARKRAWWVGLALAAAMSVPLAASWIAYPAVVANARGIDYEPLGYVPMLLAPIVAWIGRDRTQSVVEVDRQ
jgi:hypothetical protein